MHSHLSLNLLAVLIFADRDGSTDIPMIGTVGVEVDEDTMVVAEIGRAHV